MVYQIAFGVLGNSADAEDVAQETFVRAFRAIGALREPHKFSAWVARISHRLALNRVRDCQRARQREIRAFEQRDAPADVESLEAERAFAADVRERVAQLPAKLRDVMLLCAVEGLDHASVARILDIPQGTVRSRLFLARRALLKAFAS